MALTPPADEIGALFAALADWIAQGHRCAIATVIDTWGSAPRRPGSHLVMREDGCFEGSVSGGCVEGDILYAAMDAIESGAARVLEYGVADESAWQAGLACGGRIRVLVQPVAESGFPPALIEAVRAAREQGHAIAVTTDLSGGRSRIGEDARKGAFVNRYPPRLRLAIVGAVHVAQALLPIARLAGYDPVIIDPRGRFAGGGRFDLVVDEDWPDAALRRWRPDAGCAIVTLSHDPKIDDPALIAALRSDAFYIAALGSRRTHAARLDRLAAAGFGADELARIHGPAGLPIQAQGPAEIAISIMAQMTMVLRGAGA